MITGMAQTAALKPLKHRDFLLCAVCLQRSHEVQAAVIVGGFSLCESHFESDYAMEHPGFAGRL